MNAINNLRAQKDIKGISASLNMYYFVYFLLLLDTKIHIFLVYNIGIIMTEMLWGFHYKKEN